MDQALANRPYEVAGAKKHQRRLQPHRPLRGFKATASSCDDSQTAHATHSTPSPPHSRQDHETPTSPQTPDNKLHHRHAKIFKSPLRQTPPIVDHPPLAPRPTSQPPPPASCRETATAAKLGQSVQTSLFLQERGCSSGELLRNVPMAAPAVVSLGGTCPPEQPLLVGSAAHLQACGMLSGSRSAGSGSGNRSFVGSAPLRRAGCAERR